MSRNVQGNEGSGELLGHVLLDERIPKDHPVRALADAALARLDARFAAHYANGHAA